MDDEWVTTGNSQDSLIASDLGEPTSAIVHPPFLITVSLSTPIPFGHRRLSSSDSPVSRRLLRLARIIGHPLDTPSISFDSDFAISWTIVSLTDSLIFSSS